MDDKASNELFESLRGVVSSPTMAAIQSFGYDSMTEIQALAIPPLLEGKDLRGTAKTGSGKTLAFLIPAVELLNKMNFKQVDGIGVLILSPTRELAMQIHTVVKQFLNAYNTHGGCNWLTSGILTGGTDRTIEKKIFKKGPCILIATPGRLLDHLHNTEELRIQSLKCLVLDEADKMLDKHFEEAMKSILGSLPKTRQTMLFSATKTPRTNELVALALNDDFEEVDASAKKQAVTVDTLKQAFVVCPTEKKFLFLYNIIKNFEKKKKMMVFFSSCDAVKFYYELLTYVQVNVLCIHGKQEQTQRTKSFNEFTRSSSATLLCTDVAARGWDIPEVDYVLQYDPPHDPSEYIHRVGRTARGDRSGEALLVLRQEEVPFVRCLHKRRARLTEQLLHLDKLPDEQEKVESLVEGTPFLKWWAKRAWKSTIHSYTLHKRKDIFNIYNLDIKKLGKAFGLSQPPKVDLAIEYKKSGEKKLLKRIKEGYYDDIYERSDKGAVLDEDQQSHDGDVLANGVEDSQDECPPKDLQDDGHKKKKKSKRHSVDGEADVLQETDDNSSKKKISKKRSIDGEADVLQETEDDSSKNKNKSKKRSIDGEADVLQETEDDSCKNKKKSKKRSIDESDVLQETDDDSSKKKKKSKKHSIDDETDVLQETDDDSSKKKNKSKKHFIDDEIDILQETDDYSSEKKKKSKKHCVDETDVVLETDDNSSKKKRKSEKHSVDENDVLEETEDCSNEKKKKSKKRSENDENTTTEETDAKIKKKSKKRKIEDNGVCELGNSVNNESSVATPDLDCSQGSVKRKHKKNKHVETS